MITNPSITRRTLLAAAGGAGLAALAGCGNGKGPGGSGGGDTFTYWSMWKEGEPQQEVFAEAIAAFTAETGIKVDVQWSGRDVLKQVVPRLNAGNPPDLIDQGAPDIAAALGEAKGAADLSDLFATTITGEQKTISEVIPEPLKDKLTGADGKPFVVPYEVIGSTMWFNAALDPGFADAPPTTWDDFLAAMTERKSQGRTPIALDGDITDYCAYWLAWPLVRAGGPGTIAKAAADASGAAFNNEVWSSCTDAVGELIKGKFFPEGFNGTKFPTQQSAWADQSSKTNVILNGSWLPSEAGSSLSKSGKDPAGLKFGSFPFPQMTAQDKGAGVVEASPVGFAITAKARHADPAKKFVAWFMNRDRIAKIATVAKNLTPRTDVEAPPELAGYAKEYAEATSYVLFADGIAQTAAKWTTDVWQPAVGQFFGGALDTAGFRAQLTEKTVALHKAGG